MPYTTSTSLHAVLATHLCSMLGCMSIMSARGREGVMPPPPNLPREGFRWWLEDEGVPLSPRMGEPWMLWLLFDFLHAKYSTHSTMPHGGCP